MLRINFNAFKSGIFPTKVKKGEGLKILTTTQMLQRLPIKLAQVKAGNTSENLLKESGKLYILFIEQNKLREKYITI